MSATPTHTIDAAGKRLGRVASEAASYLLGKDSPRVVRNLTAPVCVQVTNASKLLIGEKKRRQKTYDRYSGYPDGRSILTMEQVIAKKGYREILRTAVYGMLPNNRLRTPRMKKLLISE